MPKRTRTPQEKKSLSISRDCRNTFGENQKAARKAIPLRKALENRRIRRKDDRTLVRGLGEDDAALDLAESSVRSRVHRIGGWKKAADEALGAVIERSLKARGLRVGRKIRARFEYKNER
jgi:hypothetical protein